MKESTFEQTIKEISRYEDDEMVEVWHRQCRNIEKVYRSDWTRVAPPYGRTKSGSSGRSFNVLWSNIQTMLPAVYSRSPKPDVSRRFNSSDPVAREASIALEKCLNYYIDRDEFKNCAKSSVLDWLLYGRGTCWVRYEPVIKKDTVQIENDLGQFEEQENEQVYFENIVASFVGYEDFGHNIARDWEEVYIVWRRLRLSREAAEERFGKDKAKELAYEAAGQEKRDEKDYQAHDPVDTALIYEVWNKRTKKVYFLQVGGKEFLDVKDDPLGLAEFFPCPRPLFGTLGNRKLIPVPDYIQYESQSEQLNVLTERMYNVQNALKVAGIYDKSADGISKMLEGGENILHGVNMNSLIEKGGLDNMVFFFPLKEMAESLNSMYTAFDQTKNHLYEITGIADILRGQGDAQETATGVRTKGQYALLRIEDRQQEAQRYVRDILRLFGEVIAEKFSEAVIYKIAGEGLLLQQQKLMIQQGMMPPDLKYNTQQDLKTMMNKPSFEEVVALLRDEPARCMRIDIETDSTIKQDQMQDKADRVEFLKSVAEYMQQMLPLAQQIPSIAPLLSQLFMFGVRGFPIGKQTEQALSDWSSSMQDQSQQENKPTKDELKSQELQAKSQIEQQKMQVAAQVEQQKMQMQMQLNADKLHNDMQREQEQAKMDIMVAQQSQSAQSQDARYQNELEHSREVEKLRMQQQAELAQREFERWRIEHESATKIAVAQLNAQAKMNTQKNEVDND